MDAFPALPDSAPDFQVRQLAWFKLSARQGDLLVWGPHDIDSALGNLTAIQWACGEGES